MFYLCPHNVQMLEVVGKIHRTHVIFLVRVVYLGGVQMQVIVVLYNLLVQVDAEIVGYHLLLVPQQIIIDQTLLEKHVLIPQVTIHKTVVGVKRVQKELVQPFKLKSVARKIN